MELKPIGVISSPYRRKQDAPRQGRLSDTLAVIEVFDQYAPGLMNVDKSTHLFVLYWGHLADRSVLRCVTPFGPEPTGVFSCRSPNRPNPLALCIVDVVKVEGNRITVRGLDALDGSPLLDLKAYSGALDSVPEASVGWHANEACVDKPCGGEGCAE